MHMGYLDLGGVASPEEVLARVHDAEPTMPDWVLGISLDPMRFAPGSALHRLDLDKISQEKPILLRHVNGHASFVNSAALERAGIHRDAPDPAGGTFVRDAAGEFTGEILEHASEHVWSTVPNPSREEMVNAILRAAESMASYGIRTASDMMTGRYDLLDELHAYRIATERGSPVRFRLYVQWSTVFGPRALDPEHLRAATDAMDPDRCRVAGIKIFADGAIGSATAAMSEPYLTGGTGKLIYSPEKLTHMVRTAADAGYSVAVHSIGDHSTQLVMDSFAKTEDPARHRLEHAMLLSEAQIDQLAELGCFVTMQPEFLVRFGHSYARQLGPERSARLKQWRTLMDRGIPVSFSSDRPIVSGDPMALLRCATHRPAPFDPGENVGFDVALAAITSEAARANGDAGWGQLVVGSTADPMRLSTHPRENVS